VAREDYDFLSSVSAHPNRPGDTANFNPQFAGNLAAAIRDARAQGLNVGVGSGYRAYDTLWNQGERTKAAQYDYGGNSGHSFGLAADISGIGNPGSATSAQWNKIAAAHGLYNPYFGGNPVEWNHYQAYPTKDLPPDVKTNLLAAAKTGNFSNVWSAGNQFLSGQPTTAAASTAMPARAGTPTPGTQYKSPFDIVTGIESSGQNFNQQIKDKNYDPATGKGNPARGYLQIIDPTWRTYAPTVGVDINKYPTALDAPKDVQYKVGAAIPVNQWGPNSQAALKKAGYSWTGDQTLGQLQSGAINPPATPGTSITSTAVPAGGSGVLPGFTTKEASDKFSSGLEQINKGMGGDDSSQGGQGQQGPPQMPPMPQIPFGGRNVGPLGGAMVGAAMVDPRMAAGSYGTLLNSIGNMQPPPANPTAVAPGAQPGAPPGAGYGPQGQLPGLMPTGLTALQMQQLSPYALGMQQAPYGTGLTSTGGLGYG
jgi:hypothetical protein